MQGLSSLALAHTGIVYGSDQDSRGQEEAQQRDNRVSYSHVAPPSNSQTLQPSKAIA